MKFLSFILTFCTLAFFASLAPPACAQVGLVPRTVALTNLPTVIAASFASNVNTGIFPLYKSRGFAVTTKTACTNAATGTNAITFDISWDGTNWTTTGPLLLAGTHNGTTAVINFTNFPPAVVDNVRYGRVRTISNGHTASMFLSNIWISITP